MYYRKVNQSSEFACNFGSQVTYLLGSYCASISAVIAFPGACHHTHCNTALTWKRIIIREAQISNSHGWNHHKNELFDTLDHYCMSSFAVQSVSLLQSAIIVGFSRNCTSSSWTSMIMSTFISSTACCKMLSPSAVTTICRAPLWT